MLALVAVCVVIVDGFGGDVSGAFLEHLSIFIDAS